MVEPISGAFIAGEVVKFLASTFAGKAIDKWLSDKKKKKAFEKALEQSLIKVAEAGFTIKGPGGLDDSFLTNDAVTKELWAKLLDPTVDEEIDYGLLEKELKGIYQDVSIGPKEVEAIEFFVDALMDQMWAEDALRDLLTAKILRQHDLKLSQAKKKALIRDYLKKEGSGIKQQLDEEIGEGNHYVEPLIEKKEKRKEIVEKREREEKRIKERFPPEEVESFTKYQNRIGNSYLKFPAEEVESFTPIDMNTYFIESSDRKVVVVADSGYGKTTLLKELLVHISNIFESKTFGVDTPIPIYFTPSQAADCSEGNIINIVTGRLMDSGCRESKVRQFVQDQFHKHTGGFIFLVDALDQVFERQNLLGALEGRCFRDNRVVLTTRPNVYDMEKGHLGDYVYLRIREFDEDRWVDYLGEEKLEALQEIVDEEFLSVPILLRLIVEYWAGDIKKTEPIKNRAELYSKMFNKLLGRQEDKDAARAVRKEERDLVDVRDDLLLLSHDGLVEGYLGQLPRHYAKKLLGETKLSDLVARRGILKIMEPGKELAFRHRSFQEYLAAEYLNSHIKTEKDLDKLESYLYHPNWEESLRFLAGLLNDKMVEGLIDRILNMGQGKPLFLYLDHLRLASLCLNEITKIGQSQRGAIIEELKSDVQDYALRGFAISILTALKDRKAVNAFEDLLTHVDPDIRRSAALALWGIKSEEAADSLMRVLEDKDEESNIRLIAAYALREIRSERVVELLIKILEDKDVDSDVRRKSVNALTKIRSERVVELLIKILEDKDEDSDVRGGAASALGEIKSEKGMQSLIKVLEDKDEDSSVRWIAASALGEIKSEKAVQFLMGVLEEKDEESHIRSIVAYALGEVRSERAVELLMKILEDKHEDSYVRGSVAGALLKLRSVEAVKIVIKVLEDKDEDSHVRGSAVYFLGGIRSERAVELLIKVLEDKDEDSHVRRNVAYVLEEIRSERAVELLIKVLEDEDEDSHVRRIVAYVLGEIGPERAVELLIKVLEDKDQDSYIRSRAADAFVKIRSEKAVELLIKVLEDEDEDSYVRRYAAYALGEIGTSEVLTKLVALWNKKDPNIEGADLLDAIRTCDRKVRSQQPIEPIDHESF
jgi:HEAT repeat protein